MKLGRFTAILDAYGADPAHWPARERNDALVLSRSSVAAARALAQARALDAALRDMPAFEVDMNPVRLAQLHDKIMTGVHSLPRTWFGRILGIDLAPAQLWPSLAGLAVAAMLGVAVGMSGLMQLDTNSDSDDLVISSIDIPAAAQ